jgi:hypothetical protein
MTGDVARIDDELVAIGRKHGEGHPVGERPSWLATPLTTAPVLWSAARWA